MLLDKMKVKSQSLLGFIICELSELNYVAIHLLPNSKSDTVKMTQSSSAELVGEQRGLETVYIALQRPFTQM